MVILDKERFLSHVARALTAKRNQSGGSALLAALDVGTQKCGIATVDLLRAPVPKAWRTVTMPYPIPPKQIRAGLFAETLSTPLLHLNTRESHLVGVLVGDPLLRDGTASRQSEWTRSMILALDTYLRKEHHLELPFHFYDERLSTQAARSMSIMARVKTTLKQKAPLKDDAKAAAWLLQSWLQETPSLLE